VFFGWGGGSEEHGLGCTWRGLSSVTERSSADQCLRSLDDKCLMRSVPRSNEPG